MDALEINPFYGIHCCEYRLYDLALRIYKKELEINNIDFECTKMREKLQTNNYDFNQYKINKFDLGNSIISKYNNKNKQIIF